MGEFYGSLAIGIASGIIGFAVAWGAFRAKLEMIPKLQEKMEQKINEMQQKYENLTKQFITQAEFERYSSRVERSLQTIESDIKKLLQTKQGHPELS